MGTEIGQLSHGARLHILQYDRKAYARARGTVPQSRVTVAAECGTLARSLPAGHWRPMAHSQWVIS